VTWKDKALEVIIPVLAQHRQFCRDGLMNRSELRRELNKVYPFGQRVNHPYKVWCAVVNEAIEDVFGVEQTEIEELPLLNQSNYSIL
jgi:hypothetical protein